MNKHISKEITKRSKLRNKFLKTRNNKGTRKLLGIPYTSRKIKIFVKSKYLRGDRQQKLLENR